jgi:hypothetical protein
VVVNVFPFVPLVQLYVPAEPFAVKVAVCPLQNALAEAEMLSAGAAPFTKLTEEVLLPQTFVTVAVTTPVFVTVIEGTLVAPVLQLMVPDAEAVSVTVFPAQRVVEDALRLMALDGPSMIFTEAVAVPQALVSVAVYKLPALTVVLLVLAPLLQVKEPVLPAVVSEMVCAPQITVDVALMVKAGEAPGVTVAV